MKELFKITRMKMLMIREADWAMGGAALGLLAALVEMLVGKVSVIISVVGKVSGIVISEVIEVSAHRHQRQHQHCHCYRQQQRAVVHHHWHQIDICLGISPR